MAKVEKVILVAIANEATEILKETKNPVVVTPEVSDAVLGATATTIKKELIENDQQVVAIPYLGTFTTKFVPGGMRSRRNFQTNENYMAKVEDKHKVSFKIDKKFSKSFNKEKLEYTKK